MPFSILTSEIAVESSADGKQGDRLAPQTLCFDPDFRRTVMVFEPLGQGQEMRSSDAQRT